MKPRTLEIQAFRGWRQPVTLDVDAPITLLVGENRAGKSSTTNAIEWCLYGSAIESKRGGIAERQAWEVHTRGVPDRDTVVTLVLDQDGRRIDVTRRRAPNAKKSAPDEFVVRRDGEPPMEGEAATLWLREAGLPSWEAYRRAACFHQEAARQRILDKGDRDTILATLLGLEDDIRVCTVTRGQARASFIKEIDAVLRDLERSLGERLARPRRDLENVERALMAQGVPRADLGAERTQQERHRLVASAHDLAARLGIPPAIAALPDPDDAAAVRTWAAGWPNQVRRAETILGRLPDLRTQRAALDGAAKHAGPAQQAWREARDARMNDEQRHGNEAARMDQLTKARAARSQAQRERKRLGALAALLKDARQLVPDANTTPCPVCTTQVEDLGPRIGAAISNLQSNEAIAADGALKQADRSCEAAEAAIETLRKLKAAEERTNADLRKQRERLAAILEAPAPEGDESTVHDLVAAAKARLAAIDEEGKRLRHLEDAQDDALGTHAEASDLLGKRERWDTLQQTAERVVDLDALPSMALLDSAIDEAAAFTADVEALADMAREAQEARSQSREEEVNESLRVYFALITGAGIDVRVRVHRTAKTITYRLEDESRQAAVPVLNQAALNALSLAMLFAQAEARARAGGTAFVVLDDPVQSLDEARQRGLAHAIERLAATCHVLAAATPSPLVDEIQTTVSLERRVHHLAPAAEGDGASLIRTASL